MQSTIRTLRPFTSTARPYRSSSRAQVHRIRAPVHSATNPANECSTSGSDNIWWRSLAAVDIKKAQPVAAATLLVLGMVATAGAASATDLGDMHSQPLAELAEQDDLIANMVRSGRYFVTVMLGTGYVMLRPLQAMMKRPVTAVLGIAAIIALVFGVRTALEYMLGVNEYAYNPDNFRIVSQY